MIQISGEISLVRPGNILVMKSAAILLAVLTRFLRASRVTDLTFYTYFRSVRLS